MKRFVDWKQRFQVPFREQLNSFQRPSRPLSALPGIERACAWPWDGLSAEVQMKAAEHTLADFRGLHPKLGRPSSQPACGQHAATFSLALKARKLTVIQRAADELEDSDAGLSLRDNAEGLPGCGSAAT